MHTDTRSPRHALLLTQPIAHHGSVLPDAGATYCVGMLAMVVRPKCVGLCPAGEEDMQVTGSCAQRISELAGQAVPVAPLHSSPPTSQDPSKLAAFSSAPQLMEGSFCSLSLCHTPEPPQDSGAPTQEVP